MEWAFSYGWVGMSFSRSILLPFFASLSASSFPMIFVWALTLNMTCMFILNSRFHIPYLVLARSHISLVSCLGGVNDPSM